MFNGARPAVLADAGSRVDGLALDALAYADDDLLSDPSIRTQVDSLILDEMGRMDVPDYFAESGLPSSEELQSASAMVRGEMARLERGDPPARLDVGRYTKVEAPSGDAAGQPQAWEAAVTHAEVALEAQTLRALNLELMSKYGTDSWKLAVAESDRLAGQARSHVASLSSSADAVNTARKAAQEPQAARLKTLARKYAASVDANFQTELACADAETEVKRLRKLVAEASEKQ